MGYKHDQATILDAGVALVLDDGLTALTFGRVAKRVGLPDRTVVYYFPTKDDLLRAVVSEMGVRLCRLVETAFGTAPLPIDALARRAWPVLSGPESDQLFSVLFELIGGDRQPDLLAAFVAGWIDWLSERVDASTPEARRAGALAVIATIDGLLVLRRAAGADVADEAAVALGIAAPST